MLKIDWLVHLCLFVIPLHGQKRFSFIGFKKTGLPLKFLQGLQDKCHFLPWFLWIATNMIYGCHFCDIRFFKSLAKLMRPKMLLLRREWSISTNNMWVHSSVRSHIVWVPNTQSFKSWLIQYVKQVCRFVSHLCSLKHFSFFLFLSFQLCCLHFDLRLKAPSCRGTWGHTWKQWKVFL